MDRTGSLPRWEADGEVDKSSQERLGEQALGGLLAQLWLGTPPAPFVECITLTPLCGASFAADNFFTCAEGEPVLEGVDTSPDADHTPALRDKERSSRRVRTGHWQLLTCCMVWTRALGFWWFAGDLIRGY